MKTQNIDQNHHENRILSFINEATLSVIILFGQSNEIELSRRNAR